LRNVIINTVNENAYQLLEVLLHIDFLLAYYCAPTLYGLKPSNLILHETFNAARAKLAYLEISEALKQRGIKMLEIWSCPERTLTLVYDEARLEAVLAEAEAAVFLMSLGYSRESTLSEKLALLKERMAGREAFPHEVGVFLGYPMSDVLGFITHRGKHCKYCGYWKVYGDVACAKQLFDTFTAVRDELLLRLQRGAKLSEIIQSA
jgi:hypothetical protein